jgi:hypothetical protein
MRMRQIEPVEARDPLVLAEPVEANAAYQPVNRWLKR